MSGTGAMETWRIIAPWEKILAKRKNDNWNKRIGRLLHLWTENKDEIGDVS